VPTPSISRARLEWDDFHLWISTIILETFTLIIERDIAELIGLYWFKQARKKDDKRGKYTYVTHINCICLRQNNLGDIRHDVDFGLVSLPCLFIEVLGEKV
jgi:hypothetical protein